jgi:Domain of unknown function (DUF4232)
MITRGAQCLLWAAGLSAAMMAGVAGCTHAAVSRGMGTGPTAPGTGTVTAAASAPTPARTAPAGGAGVPECRGSRLKVTMIYGGAAAGTVSGVLGFANQGKTRCRLAGWPAVVAVSPGGRARARRTLSVFAAGTFAAPPLVVLRPGASAVAVLAAGDHPAPPLARCGPAYRRLRVTPPGSTHLSVVSARIPDYASMLPACTPIRVSPVVPFSAVPYLAQHGVSG